MDNDSGSKHNTISWITSLAITVTCCAVQFIIFAGYIFDLKEDIAVLRIRFDIAEQRLNTINAEIDNIHHHNVQQIQIMPGPDGRAPQLPVQLTPDGAVPLGTAAPAEIPAGTSAPSISMPATVPLSTDMPKMDVPKASPAKKP